VEAAVTTVIDRHEILRTRFELDEGTFFQRVLPPHPAQVDVVDLTHLPAASREARLAECIRSEAARPFDLTDGMNLRVVVFRLEVDEHAIIATLHHVAADGWSMNLLAVELTELYRAAVEDRAPTVPSLPVQFTEQATWEAGHKANRAEGVRYWAEV